MNRTPLHEQHEMIVAAGREYRCRFVRDRAGGFLVTCPELPPVMAYGATLSEARTHATQEIEAWLPVCENAGSVTREAGHYL